MNTNKTKNALLFVLVFICLSFVLYRLIRSVSMERKLRRELYKIERLQDISETRLNNLQSRFKMFFFNENHQLSDDLILKNESGHELKLSDLVKNDKKLVLRISNTHCSACLHDLCPLVARYIKHIGKENLIYISDYENSRVLKVLKSNYKIENEVYTIKQLNLPIETSNTPFLFILDKHLQVELLFVPIKEIPKLTEDYLNAIKHRFFEQ